MRRAHLLLAIAFAGVVGLAGRGHAHDPARSSGGGAGPAVFDYRNRSFDPATGRFLQRDPVLGGDPAMNPYCFPGNNPVSNMDPMGTRVLIANDAKDQFHKWYGQNCTLGAKLTYEWPKGNEGSYAEWRGGLLGTYGYASRFSELVIGQELNAGVLNEKDVTLLGAILDPDNVYVFDQNGWRMKTAADEGGWFSRADLAMGRASSVAESGVRSGLAWVGEKMEEWELDELGNALIPVEGIGYGPKFAAWGARSMAALRITRAVAKMGALGEKLAPKLAATLGESGMLAKLTGTTAKDIAAATAAGKAAESGIVRLEKKGRLVFEGKEVRGARDLSHLPESTLRFMAEKGVSADDIRGVPLVMHHYQQNPAGFLIEMPATKHNVHNLIQHPFGNAPGVGLTELQREAFNAWRSNYWKARAREELVRRGLQ